MTAVRKVTEATARKVAESLALDVGACVRPLAVRRRDTQTGRVDIVPIPCGSTRASVCQTCAERARRLRVQQCREGWHLDCEPEIVTAEPTRIQLALVGYRADLEAARAAAERAGNRAAIAKLDEQVGETDVMLHLSGLRGSIRTGREGATPRRLRSTRRRQDVPDLPRRRMVRRTVGRSYRAPNGRTYQPSTFLTATLPSYGKVTADGSPVDPGSYDYRRAARDAIHFASLVDRLWQNLRRACGWNAQYFAAVEPQRRGAPHLHAAIRGTLSRGLLRQVVAATYHQVWWPEHDEPVYAADRLPVWDETAETYTDPRTGEPLPKWQDALDRVTRPAHVVRFGAQVNIKGVLGGTGDADRCIGYLAKYLTKSVAECVEPETDDQAEHVRRLADALRFEPCSPRCANWLLFGVQPDGARAGMVPGQCRGKAHRAATLGYGGRRCLVSRLWSGKSLTDHRADNRAHVLRVLGAVGRKPELSTVAGDTDRYEWQPVRPTDPDQPNRTDLLLRSIAERRRWREQYERARDTADLSAIDDQAA